MLKKIVRDRKAFTQLYRKQDLVRASVLITKILVPLDGSDQSKNALDYAVNLAVQTSAEIHLLTVVPPVFLPSYSFYVVKSHTIRDCEEELYLSFKGVLEKALEYVNKKKTKLKFSAKLEKGLPYKIIVKKAREGDFDLIIMGSRGLEGRISFQGSVSSRVIDEAPCPVLLIKQKYIRSSLRTAKSTKRVKE